MLSDEEIAHTLNETLLKEASEIKAERKLLKERMNKLEETRSSVSDAVYQKVRADYTTKQNQTTEKLLALRKDLEKEEKILLEKKVRIESSIKSHKEKIEESNLRHSLGEYTKKELEEVTNQATQQTKKLEEALKKLDEGLSRHREIFEGEELPKEPVKAPPSAPAHPPSEVSAKSTDSKIDSTSRIKLESTQKVPELHVIENGKVIQMLPIDKAIQIGRSPANDVILKEPKVSRKHAEIQCVGGKYVLLDLESSNGTYVAGQKVKEYTLQAGDEIVIGNTKMIFKI